MSNPCTNTNNIKEYNQVGQHIKGYQSKSCFEDTYNYSIHHGQVPSIYPGECISIIDRTLVNGVYPLGQHQAYRNTSDGISYSVMLKGEKDLQEGTFVTFDKLRHNERLIGNAKNDDDVIGVITKSSGFIANAGQFPASTRIIYDKFHSPIIKHNEHSDNDLVFPSTITVLKDGVDRSSPYVPYTERQNYYQVVLCGLVVVRTYCANRLGDKCGVDNGMAVSGNKYWIVKIIDNTHIMILLK